MSTWANKHTFPRRIAYPILAAALAQGAPLGLFLLRRFLAAHDEFNGLAIDYAYLSLSTTVVFSTLGYLVGRRQDSTSREAFTDALTGLTNRRGFSARIERKLQRASATTPVSLLLIDVDHLKRINDEGGHARGDAALRAVADALRSVSRASDITARTGGDEFAVVGDLTGQQAGEVGARINRHMRKTLPDGMNEHVSVSIGAVCCTQPTSEEDAIKRADRALYRAKEEGRNRTVLEALTLGSPSERSGIEDAHDEASRKE